MLHRMRKGRVMRFFVKNIVWETDGERPEQLLPKEAWVECDDEEKVANALSDIYGWLISELEIIERVEKPPE